MQKSEKLTPEQIEHWRNILFGIVGPFAFLMPDEEVQRYKDKMQAEIYKMGKETKKGALED